MLSKEECEVALENLKIQHDYLASNMHYNYPFSIEMLEKVQYCFEELITEHFELVEEYERYKSIDEFVKSTEKFYVNDTYFGHIVRAISKCDDKEMQEYAIHCLTYLKQQLSRYENPQPYKFEDLKVGMWVWDDKERKYNKIIYIDENCKTNFYYITESISRYIVQFEDNRFYPVQMANARCEKDDE